MWKYKKNYLQTKDYIYFFALVLFLVSSMLSKTMWIYSLGDSFDFILKLMRYAAYIICAFKIVFDNYFFSDFWKVTIIVLCTVIAGYFVGGTFLFTYIFLFIAAYKVEKRIIIKYYVCIQFWLWATIVISSQIGLNIDYIFDAGTRNRHGLGFTWTTTPAVFFFFILIEYLYIRKKRTKNVEYIVILLLSYFLYQLTDSRFTFFVSVMSAVGFWLLNNVNFIRLIMKKMRAVWIMLPSFIAYFSYYIHQNYKTGNWLWEKFNDLLSGRLRLGKAAIEKYGITLFGQKIEWISQGYQSREALYNYVDCSYLQILIQNGAICLGICLIMYTFVIWKSIQEEDYHLCGCIVMILIYSITEAFLLHLVYNPFPLLAVSYLGERKRL